MFNKKSHTGSQLWDSPSNLCKKLCIPGAALEAPRQLEPDSACTGQFVTQGASVSSKHVPHPDSSEEEEARFQELPPTRTVPACCQQVVNPELASTGQSRTLRGTWGAELGPASYWEHRPWPGYGGTAVGENSPDK